VLCALDTLKRTRRRLHRFVVADLAAQQLRQAGPQVESEGQVDIGVAKIPIEEKVSRANETTVAFPPGPRVTRSRLQKIWEDSFGTKERSNR
jgi:hypothetical protein